MMFFKTISYLVTILFVVQNCFVSCQEKGSLSFVVDNTASMNAERVKHAIGIITDVFDQNRVHEEKIVVTFNDPEVNLHSVSKTKTEFENALKTIIFRDGGDCLENALAGVELALNRSQYGSHLYVFTDNPPKDSELTDRTIELCQQKNIQVVFVIYPHRPCSQWNITFLPYYKIAQACPGQIFRLHEASDAEWIIPYVKETVEGPTIPLTAKIMEPATPAYKWDIIEFTTDELINYAVISITGNGEIKDQGDFENKVWIRYNKVRKLSTGIGKQSVKVHASDIASVVVFGRTNFDFQYGFSEVIPLNMLETVKQPFAGVRTFLSIYITDPGEDVAEVSTAQILDMKENVVQELSLQSTLKPLYFSGGFSPPDTKFKIAVNVKVKKTGNIVKRINKIPVQPKVSTGSNIDENMKIYLIIGESKNITCPLKTDSSQSTKWYRNWVLQSEFHDTYYPINNASTTHDANYTCEVNNTRVNFEVDVGWKVVLDGRDYYEQIWDGRMGQSLICEASSKRPSKYEWFLNGKPILSSTGAGNTAYITDWGDYICRVRNVHGDMLKLIKVTSDGCVINKILEKEKNIPLMLNTTGSIELLNLAYSNEQYIIVPKEKILTLSCLERNVFVKFTDKNQLTTKCVNESLFMIDEKLYPFSDLHCNKQIIPETKDTNRSCFDSSNSTIKRFGFNDKSDFITVFEACLNLTDAVPHFTRIDITKPDSEGTDYSERYVYGVNDTTIGNVHSIGNDTYTIGQLIGSTDVPFGPAQLATYLPNWNQILILQPPEATVQAAWRSLEVEIRNVFLNEAALKLRVVTGISNVTKTEDGLLVSRYLWKWIQNLANREIIVAIYVNHPTLDVSDQRCHKESSCDNEWINLKEDLPRFYCCDEEDFKKGFPWIKI